MLEADSPRTATSFWTPPRKAWLVIFTALLIFSSFVGTGAVTFVRYLRTPATPTLMVRVVQRESVLIRRATFKQPNPVSQSDQLNVGDTLLTAEKASPGVVGTVYLSPGEIAAWANTELQVDQRRAPDQPLHLLLHRGQVLVDLPVDASPLEIEASGHVIRLSAPGRYRVRQLSQDSLTTGRAEYAAVPDTEVAVAEGEAMVGTTRVPAGARALLNKGSRGFAMNAWPLLRDGQFREWSADDYNHTMVDDPKLKRADTWQVTVQPVTVGPNAEPLGQFDLVPDCPRGQAQQNCPNAAHFVRTGQNSQDSITAITQGVDADVVAYAQVKLTAKVRISYQSLSKAGSLGTECPVLITVTYANDQKGDLKSQYCFWAFVYADQTSRESSYQWIKTFRTEPNIWYPFSVDLKRDIPNLLAIQQIEIHANGHDYDTSVADVHLDGIDLTTQPLPLRQPGGGSQRVPRSQ